MKNNRLTRDLSSMKPNKAILDELSSPPPPSQTSLLQQQFPYTHTKQALLTWIHLLLYDCPLP
jgi:hypothetical protein